MRGPEVSFDEGVEDVQDPAGEAIGRPKDWSEGRYERQGDDKQPAVLRKPGEDLTPAQPISTPVTQNDYGNAQPAHRGKKPEET